MKKGLAGIFNLNAALQGKLNPPRPGLAEKRYRDIVFRENDRVMHIKNNYSLSWRNGGEKESVIAGEGVFNGDMGIIQEIDVDNSFLTVSYDDGKVVEYDFDMLDQLELAYAITVHKARERIQRWLSRCRRTSNAGMQKPVIYRNNPCTPVGDSCRGY